MQERDLAKNPRNLNYITSSRSDDTGIFTCTVNFPCSLQDSLCIAASDYLGVTYSAGTGGTIAAANWVQAAIEASVRQSRLELIADRNPENRFQVSYNVSNATIAGENNSVFTGNYTLPTTMTLNAQGDQTVVAVVYLTDA
ncbi:MAG: hypothetical protein HC925_00090 [Coleofasciculaceae cyanobacterium SM2_3_26]|nr:hypothetical protein [Coleofasciculaceae cyanobacterium SM2_3_26]